MPQVPGLAEPLYESVKQQAHNHDQTEQMRVREQDSCQGEAKPVPVPLGELYAQQKEQEQSRGIESRHHAVFVKRKVSQRKEQPHPPRKWRVTHEHVHGCTCYSNV